MKKAIAFAGLLALAPVATAETYEGFKPDTITAVFKEVGATDFSTQMFGDEPRIMFKLSGTSYSVDFYNCKDMAKGCKLLQYTIAFEPDATDTIEAVNAYNFEYVYGKAALTKKEGLLSFHVIDGGLGSSKEQVLYEFSNFQGATNVLIEHMKKGARVAAAGSGNAMLSFEASMIDPRQLARLRSLPRNRRP